MILNILTILICIVNNNAKLTIDITAGSSPKDVVIKYSGIDTRIVTENDIKLFNINERKLKEAVKKHYGEKPSNCYVKSPTPWGDLYKKNHWEQVVRVLTVKTATTKTVTSKPIVVMTEDFDNFSNKTIKVNTGISHTIENSVTTSWSQSNEVTLSQEVDYEINVSVGKVTGKTGVSYSATFGHEEEISETNIIGTTTSVETELKPGQFATAVLSANRGYLEVRIVYSLSLRGNLAVNYKRKFKGHHFWAPSIQEVMKSGGLVNEYETMETIKINYYSDATLKVFDKVTLSPL